MQGADPTRALVPQPGDQARVRAGFVKKLARVAARIPFAGDVAALWFAARDPATPKKTKAMMMAALAYFVMPADAIPDIFAGVGFTDDAAVIAAMIALAGSSLRDRHRQAGRALLERWKA